MTTQMIIRVDESIKYKLGKLAREEGKSTSKVIRELIHGYLKEHDIEEYIDGLWSRIGKKLKSKGFGVEDVPRIIKEVRALKH